LKRYREKINVFGTFLRKAVGQVERQKDDMKVFMDMVHQSYAHYDKFYESFVQYEDIALDYYADGQLTERSFTHPGAVETKESIKTTIKQWKNPYIEGYIWIKGELLDLDAPRTRSKAATLCKRCCRNSS